MKSAFHLFAALLISSLMLAPLAQGQAKQSNREKEGLLGPVRTVVRERADLSGDLKKPIEVSRYRDQSVTYDRQGNLVEALDYGAPSGTDIIERALCSYDPEGHLLIRTYSGPGLPAPAIKQSDISSGDRSADGALLTKVVFVYDPQGKLIESTLYRGSGAFVIKEIYKYDAKNRLIEANQQNASGASAKVTYSYHDDGRLPASEIGADGWKVNYSYELDSQGNWIKRVGLFEPVRSKSVGSTYYRTISYYGPISASDQLPKSGAKATSYYVVPAGLVKAVPYEVVAELNPSAPPPHGVIEKRGILVPGQVMTRVQPIYPTAAKLARIGGEVRVEAVIDEEGNVIYARATSGHPLLRDSAEIAARQWKFSPTTVDGKAVKVLSAIILRFNL